MIGRPPLARDGSKCPRYRPLSPSRQKGESTFLDKILVHVVRYRSRTLSRFALLAAFSRHWLFSREHFRFRGEKLVSGSSQATTASRSRATTRLEKSPTHLLLASTRTNVHLVYRASRPLAMPSASDLR